jgi:hypothetical protein
MGEMSSCMRSFAKSCKVETPIHDNDLILTPITSVVDNELEVARNFTWAVLGMEDGNF